MLANLSYRHKTPLAMSLVIVVAAAVVAGALVWQGYAQAHANFIQHSQVLGKTLARTLRSALVHDDIWQAYEILLTPLDRSGDAGRVLVLLDPRGHVFAASEPRQFAVLDDYSHVFPCIPMSSVIPWWRRNRGKTKFRQYWKAMPAVTCICSHQSWLRMARCWDV